LSAFQVKYVISATSFGSTQWTRERTSGDPKRVLRDGGTLKMDGGGPHQSKTMMLRELCTIFAASGSACPKSLTSSRRANCESP
jgi:hypothetical protein